MREDRNDLNTGLIANNAHLWALSPPRAEIELGEIVGFCPRERPNVCSCFHAIGRENFDVLLETSYLLHRACKHPYLCREVISASVRLHLRKQRLAVCAQCAAVPNQHCEIIPNVLWQVVKSIFRFLGTRQKRLLPQPECALQETDLLFGCWSTSIQSPDAVLMQDIQLRRQFRDLVYQHSSDDPSVAVPRPNDFQVLLLGDSCRLGSNRRRFARRPIGKDCNDCCGQHRKHTNPNRCPGCDHG